MNKLPPKGASLKVPPSCWENHPESAPAVSISRPSSPTGCLGIASLTSEASSEMAEKQILKTFPPGAHSPQGTPAIQTTHCQFNSHQINLFLTYREGLNTGLTPGQMPLASKQPGVGPPKSLPLVWEKAINPKWHLHIQSSSCINVNLMSASKWTQSPPATTARCESALPALCKCVLMLCSPPAFLRGPFHYRVLEIICQNADVGERQSVPTKSNLYIEYHIEN